MKHLAVIQSEFLKAARDWEEMSYDEQKAYLQQHRKSKRKITAKPKSKTTGLKGQLKDKRKNLGSSLPKTELAKISDVGFDNELTNLKHDITSLYKVQPFDVIKGSVESDGFKIKFKNKIADLPKMQQLHLINDILQMNDPQTYLSSGETKEEDERRDAFSDIDLLSHDAKSFDMKDLPSELKEDLIKNNIASFWWDDTYETINDPDDDQTDK